MLIHRTMLSWHLKQFTTFLLPTTLLRRFLRSSKLAGSTLQASGTILILLFSLSAPSTYASTCIQPLWLLLSWNPNFRYNLWRENKNVQINLLSPHFVGFPSMLSLNAKYSLCCRILMTTLTSLCWEQPAPGSSLLWPSVSSLPGSNFSNIFHLTRQWLNWPALLQGEHITREGVIYYHKFRIEIYYNSALPQYWKKSFSTNLFFTI